MIVDFKMKFALSGSGNNRIVYVGVAFSQVTNTKHDVKKITV